jgi:hypothetical protein
MLPVLQRIFETSPAYERLRYARKIRALRREAGLSRRCMDPGAEHRAIEYWRGYGLRLNLAWHRSYTAVFAVPDSWRYIPEDIYYAYMEPAMNRYELAEAYSDKNNYDRLFSNAPMLPVLLRMMNGRWYDREYSPLTTAAADSLLRGTEGTFIVKPSLASGDGIGVRKFIVESGTILLDEKKVGLPQLEAMYERDFLLQPCFHQHPAIAEFHPASVNTTRFYTYRIGNRIDIAAAVLRCGNFGRYVDNRGIPCGIQASGRLNDQSRTKYFQTYDAHPVTQKPFKGFVLPGWQAARSLVTQLHEQLPYFDAISWDIAVGPDERPSVIEFNLRYQEINFLQVNNGPLFGDRTEEVLAHVFRRQLRAGPHVSASFT